MNNPGHLVYADGERGKRVGVDFRHRWKMRLEKSFVSLDSRLTESLKGLDSLLGSGAARHDSASDSLLTAKTPLALPAIRQVAARRRVNTYKFRDEMYAIHHMMYRNAHNSRLANVRRSVEGTEPCQIQAMVNEAVRFGTPAKPATLEFSFGRTIGSNQGGGLQMVYGIAFKTAEFRLVSQSPFLKP